MIHVNYLRATAIGLLLLFAASDAQPKHLTYPTSIVRYEKDRKSRLRISDPVLTYEDGTMTLKSFTLHNDSDSPLLRFNASWKLTSLDETQKPGWGVSLSNPVGVVGPHSSTLITGIEASENGVPLKAISVAITEAVFANGYSHRKK
ncbi:MAG: hypothetical protein H7039_12265 [Bryobacteraceae bacterium]|nr:hypothetical protein [Bryobacteraceae bacterium]